MIPSPLEGEGRVGGLARVRAHKNPSGAAALYFPPTGGKTPPPTLPLKGGGLFFREAV